MSKFHHAPRRLAAAGRSLIELMVAILIGSLVLAGILIITASSSNISRQTDSLGGLTDTGQTALQVLASDVRMAGYSLPRTYYSAGYTTKMLSTAGIRGCDNGFTNNSVATLNLLTCNNNNNAATANGAVSIAYEADGYNSVLVKNDAGVLVPSDCRGAGLVAVPGFSTGNVQRPAVAEDTMSNAPTYWLVENRYYVANTGTDNEPTLFCNGNGGDTPFGQGVALIRGVERMVVSYGIANAQLNASRSNNVLVMTDPGVAAYMTAAQIDTNPSWVGEPTEVRWQRVVSVRMCLEIRGASGTALNPSPTTKATYTNCNGALTTIEDTRARRTVRMTMNLRNRTMTVDSVQGLGLGGV